MPTAISYIRCSHPKQALGDSLRRQLEATRAYCQRNGLALDESFRLTDKSVSAFRGRNSRLGALATFLQAVESGRVPPGTVLVIENLDRLSRQDVDEAMELFLGIIRSGVEIVTLDPERRHTRETVKTLMGLIEPLVIMARANEESAMKSSRSSAVWDQRRKLMRETNAPLKQACPWWLAYKDNQFHLIPDRVAVVRQVFASREQGHGLRQIIRRLNESDAPRPKIAKVWNVTTISYMLKNIAVLGEHQPQRIVDGKPVDDGEPIPDYFPRVITDTQFHAVQSTGEPKPRGRVPSDGTINIFRCKLYNQKDGYPVYFSSSSQQKCNGSPVYHYLVSAASLNRVPGADRRRIRYEPLERAFLQYVHVLKPSDFAKDKGAVHDETGEVAGRLAETMHKIKTIKERIKGRSSAEMTVYLDMIEELDAERRELAAKMEALKSKASNADADTVGELITLADVLDKATDPEEAKDLRVQIRNRIDQLIDRISISPSISEERRLYNRPIYSVLASVYFRDKSVRMFMFNQDGELRAVHQSHPMPGDEGKGEPLNRTYKPERENK